MILEDTDSSTCQEISVLKCNIIPIEGILIYKLEIYYLRNFKECQEILRSAKTSENVKVLNGNIAASEGIGYPREFYLPPPSSSYQYYFNLSISSDVQE